MKRVLALSAVVFLICLILGYCGDAISQKSSAGVSLETTVSDRAEDLEEPDNSGAAGTAESGSSTEGIDETDDAQPTAASGEYNDASGKIITETLSPYAAPQSFGKIYMKNSTSQEIDIEKELTTPPGWSPKLGSEPEVLILHTHATETYMTGDRDYYTEDDQVRSTDDSVNMVRVGEAMAERLRAQGISVLHDTTHHDETAYTGSYDRSCETAENYLEKYPSIKVILDLHRDSVSREEGKLKPVCQVGDRNAAQLMIVLGCEDGSAPEHPEWRTNLRLGLRFQQALEIMYPELARPLSVVAHRYNQHLAPGAMLMEIGTEANTLSEAIYTAQLAGDTLARVLKQL